jgi:nucleoside-diphosphate-sugar epimerase
MPTTYSALATSRVLITGAAGFLGSHLCERLHQCGAEIHAVSRFDRGAPADGMRWVRSGFDSADEVRRVLRTVRPDIVYHLGGHVTADPDLCNILPAFSSLLASTVHVLLHATELGCRCIVLAGSFTEPGDAAGVPGSPYAAAKWGGSMYARMFRALYRTPVVTARVFMTYGPRQKTDKVVPHVVTTLLRGEAPRLSSGALATDWVYVDDVIEALLTVAVVPAAVGEEIDIGTGTLTTTREVIGKIVDIMKTDVRPQFGTVPDRPMELVRAADVNRTAHLLGWRATTSLDSGLARTIAWHRQQIAGGQEASGR